MIWDINTGYLDPLIKKEDNPEAETNTDGTENKGGNKDYGF